MPLAKDEGAAQATRVLATTWSDIAGDGHVPVDPFRIANHLGIDVFEADLAEDVSGLIVKEYNRDPVVLLNADDSENRKRFTLAHELGHYYRWSDDDDEYHRVDRRDFVAAQGTEPDEIFSNAFAAELLMPAEHVRERHKQFQGVADLAWQFRVSEEAMRNRLRTLGLR
jgi:Zn-dependent peptidase ImmA (M78 family)